MNIGIVGHEAAKFTKDAQAQARRIIRELLAAVENPVLVSGHCHLGGVDIWAEQEAVHMGAGRLIFPPENKSWEGGYKRRNIQIARASVKVHVIVVQDYPLDYVGMRFPSCYHCHSKDHIKSGACWTAKYAEIHLGRPAEWHFIRNNDADNADCRDQKTLF